MTTLTAARVVTATEVVAPGQVEVDDGRITAVGPGPSDAPDITLCPGFVDLQVNGIGSIDVAAAHGADWDELDRLLLAQGVTAWCPTLVTSALDAYEGPLARIAEAAARSGPRPRVLGAHLEGPFLGGAPGAHRRHLIRPLDSQWLDALPEVVRLITLAPEQEGVAGAIAALRQRGVTVALGHSTATFEESDAAADAGATLVTHCFNGMASLHHRTPGLAGAALSDDRLTVSVIADLVHVHPAVLSVVFRAKGPGRVAVVTDAVAWAAADLVELGVRVDGAAPTLPDGTLAGSAVTMDQCIRNLVHEAGVPLADAVRAASTTPAEVIGALERGRIEVGCMADLVALDADLGVAAAWVGGVKVDSR